MYLPGDHSSPSPSLSPSSKYLFFHEPMYFFPFFPPCQTMHMLWLIITMQFEYLRMFMPLIEISKLVKIWEHWLFKVYGSKLWNLDNYEGGFKKNVGSSMFNLLVLKSIDSKFFKLERLVFILILIYGFALYWISSKISSLLGLYSY